MWRNVDSFRGDARFLTWLYRIGVNEAKRILERRPAAGTVLSVEERPIDDLVAEGPGPQARAESRELRDVLDDALRRLPEKYRAAVVLRDLEGLSTAEASETLGPREAAIQSRLHRGRMALRADVAAYLDRDSVSAQRQTGLSRRSCSGACSTTA